MKRPVIAAFQLGLSSPKARALFIAVSVVLSCSVCSGQVNYTPYTFTTLAGQASIGSADGTNAAARFYEPTKVVVDGAGNLYVSDNKNATIRKITPTGTNWVVTTIAGLAGDSSHVNGTGSAARFDSPDGMAIDGSGNIYVADYLYIRKITPVGGSWEVSTLTNGFYYPYGLALDAAGNIYVADSENHTIRKLSPAGPNWTVSTLAGLAGSHGSADGTNEQARFYYPQGLALDNAGNIYVADTRNHTIRKITPMGTNWVVTTWAGTAGATGEADGTGSAARFKYPQDVSLDSATNLYVGDGYAVRKITPSAVVTTLAGLTTVSADSVDGTNSAARFRWPTGLSLDSSTNIFVVDKGNNTVRKVAPVGTNWVVTTLVGVSPNGSKDGIGSEARFNLPYGVAVDSAGNSYVADTGNMTIRKITPAGLVTTIAGSPLLYAPTDGTNSDARFVGPWAIAINSAGALFVTDDSTLRKVTPVGTNWVVTTIAGMPRTPGSADGTNSAARFHDPEGVAVDSAGNVFVADWSKSTIRKVTPVGTNWVVTTIAGSPGSTGSADGTNGAARFKNPAGLAVDGAGNIFVADSFNDTIRKITPVGTNWVVTTLAGLAGDNDDTDGTNNAARFYEPAGIAVDNSGNLFVADTVNGTIRKISPSGTNWIVTTLAGLAPKSGSTDGSGSAVRFRAPNGIAVDVAGNVYVADTGNGTIRKGAAIDLSALAEALDAPSLTWTIGGGDLWTGQSIVTHDSVDAGQSGVIADSEETWIQTTVAGPGTLTYWWKVSSESGFDYLEFYTNSVRLSGRISGEVDWQQETVAIASGNNVLRWRYKKDNSTTEGQDRGWVDEVSYVSANQPPVIQTGGGSFGFTNGHFGFNISGSSGQTVIIEVSTNLQSWLPLQTNVFGAGPLHFSDPQSGYAGRRFYRVRVQ